MILPTTVVFVRTWGGRLSTELLMRTGRGTPISHSQDIGSLPVKLYPTGGLLIGEDLWSKELYTNYY